ncbi:hypothetical protein LJB99_04205 [Deltaproteobacteria bacterium OttesenSCG-928-K17]|nr:hypothetical protein [Deltaproteobacteria bacterium OttesenSCG-928-K17]
MHFVFLEVPPLPRTIILQTPHFTGQEVFTMGGRKVFIKAVNFSAFADEMMISRPEDLKSNDSSDGDDQAAKRKKPAQSEKKPTFTLVK